MPSLPRKAEANILFSLRHAHIVSGSWHFGRVDFEIDTPTPVCADRPNGVCIYMCVCVYLYIYVCIYVCID